MAPKLAALSIDDSGFEQIAELARALGLEMVRVDSGDVDLGDFAGVAIADDDGVNLRLARTVPQGVAEGRRPRHVVGAVRSARFLGVPLGTQAAGITAAVTAAQSTLARTRHDQRRRAGKRVGRRPHKPRKDITQRIADLRPRSYREVADVLNREGVASPQGKRWYPATVRRAVRASREETRMVLRRLGNLLAEIDARGTVTEEELEQLGRTYEFHHNRLWLAFQPGIEYGAPYSRRYAPPVRRIGKRYGLSKQGKTLLRVWKRSEELDDRLEGLLLAARRTAGPKGLDPASFGALCAEYGFDSGEVPARYLRFDNSTGRFSLTDEGEEVAEIWDAITNDEPRRRLDIDYWPEPGEERNLSETWDWADDPLQ